MAASTFFVTYWQRFRSWSPIDQDFRLYNGHDPVLLSVAGVASQDVGVLQDGQFFQTDRMSRVCIVVLEEVEDDSPTFFSKLPQENTSVRPSPSGNVLPLLVQAIFNGDPDEVRALIFKKEDVNFQHSLLSVKWSQFLNMDKQMHNPIRLSCQLLEMAHLDYRYKRTLKARDLQLKLLMMEKSLRPISDPESRTPPDKRLPEAASDKASTTKIASKDPVPKKDNEKRTPLHAAAYLGDAEIIELLILSGTSLSAAATSQTCANAPEENLKTMNEVKTAFRFN
ncbi:Serine/threonine-protein phosphatase 6 regulatory ankyrin repeat subunit A [Chelonia mydas]|uniref:Serine/threonine-protein phosphatase 6 regulatory ankyrin repeat subunit A n=1 Tax=Chelonia mydas TaxID=8469 RepID=M7CLC5_CHEMY|nr:Serine/threonine-protein phosphatase 6 regulatory ankyrin repeat subunit A [Chelonia mydas]